jgi:SHS2 domain-containing protein
LKKGKSTLGMCRSPTSKIMMYNFFMNEADFREIEHTADWEIEAWAPNMTQLIEQTARGMYGFINPVLADNIRVLRFIKVISTDYEGVIIKFLNELLFLLEQEGLAFDEYKIALDGFSMIAEVKGAKVFQNYKQIKAVTWHKIAVLQKEGSLTIRIVFDV